MAIIFLFIFLIVGARTIAKTPIVKFYENGKKMPNKDIKVFSKVLLGFYAIGGALITWATLMSNVYLQMTLYKMYGRNVPTFLTIALAIGTGFAYRKLGKILLEHGKLKAIEKYYRPQDTLFKLKDDMQSLQLEISHKFEKTMDEVIELFWECNHSIPLNNPESNIVRSPHN